MKKKLVIALATLGVSVFCPVYAVGLTAGAGHSCALNEAGRAYCWGYNGQGQLGDGTTTTRTQPKQVAVLQDTRKISAGALHTCAISSDKAWCWGDNARGQLGDGTKLKKSIPVEVVGLNAITDLSAGDFHSCAALTGGTAWCWGRNNHGQLGNGSLVDSSFPVQVSGLSDVVNVRTSLNFDINVASPNASTCALLGNGQVACWGANSKGTLGDGTTQDRQTPVFSAGIQDAVGVAMGREHTCVVHASGTVSCTGANYFGALGDGTQTDRTTHVPAQGLNGVCAVAAGEFHTCALTNAGAVYCWGGNNAGQVSPPKVGQGHVPLPTLLAGVSNAIGIATGVGHSCARLKDGSVRCWGANGHGQLGSTTGYSPPPTEIPKFSLGLGPFQQCHPEKSGD